MNKQPIYYLQTDSRWRSKPYQVPGETTTIGESGCGPTCAAMLIETLTGITFTPEDACKWSVQHGYKALKQGTYYSYFNPQLAKFGIEAGQLNGTNLYGKPNDATHIKAFQLLKDGYYLIACMGKGSWTRSGHFIVVWWQDDKVRINDPASTREARLNGDFETFKSQVKYYFWVDARGYNKEEEGMTEEKVQKMIDDAKPKVYTSAEEVPEWFKTAVAWGLSSEAIHGDEKGKLHLTDDNLVSLQMLYNVLGKREE